MSGSLMASRMALSSSVSPPFISTCTRLPQAWARSRITRGNFLQTFSIGCMRVFMTPSCNSAVIRLKRCWYSGRQSCCVVLN